MKKINFKVLIITCIICLVPIALGVMFYDDIPERVATHFGVDNNPNGYSSREFFVFGIPCILTLLQICGCIITDLADENTEANKKTITIMKCIIPVITVVVYIVILLYAINIKLDIRIAAMTLLGIIFIVMGNYTPKLVGAKGIYFHFGLDTIKSQSLNNKLKRIIAYMLTVNGILFILSILFRPIVSVCAISLFILQIIALYVYAFIKDKTCNEK